MNNINRTKKGWSGHSLTSLTGCSTPGSKIELYILFLKKLSGSLLWGGGGVQSTWDSIPLTCMLHVH